MIDTPSTYIPIDRRHALARAEEMPERAHGVALFADISGFTPLTAALSRELGPRRGAEELTLHLNRVFDALIDEVHAYGGSVIGFAGDAITCWLDGDDGRRAIACGLAMQQKMESFSRVETASGQVVQLAIKVAAVSGPIRRFQVGDPTFTLVDVLVGRTLEKMAIAEGVADKGDTVVSEEIVAALGEALTLCEWRTDPDSGESFAVISAMKLDVSPRPWPPLAADSLSMEQKQAWVQPPIYARMQAGRGEFLAELRPVVALFIRFSGIDYDLDPAAGEKLDRFLRLVESVLARYEASLMHLTIGDKGSYLQGAFGAPIAHEDDARRAAAAALAIREEATTLDFLDELQIGIAQGKMRTGSYGGTKRRTYGMMGNGVILAARLMSAAQPGEILVAADVSRQLSGAFIIEELTPIQVKGREDLIALSRLKGAGGRAGGESAESRYSLPMVGRNDERQQLRETLQLAGEGRGQVVGITAEAGMGKSRLAAAVVDDALRAGFTYFGGECQSFGLNTAYLVWRDVWRTFFGLDDIETVDEQIEVVERRLTEMDPALLPRMPLLGSILNLSIPDSDLTRTFDPKLRKASLESMMTELVRAGVEDGPMIIVLDDCHWLDPLSHDLLESIARTIAGLPILLVVVYRPPDLQRVQRPRVEQLPHFSEVTLTHFDEEEATELIRLKLEQFFGSESDVPAHFVSIVTRRAAGNPFYIEEILNYLRDLNVDPHDQDALAALDLPSSIYSLILSRIDQLAEAEQITLRVASVIGRLFAASLVWGVYPELGGASEVQNELNRLGEAELIQLETREPELLYLFKHVITQEAAYESLPFATRSALHEDIGLRIEADQPEQQEQNLDRLAFHFDRSPNVAKKRLYLRLAGESASADYANEAAIDYFRRALPHLEGDERGEVELQLGLVLEILGNLDEAKGTIEEALDVAEAQTNRELEARCRIALGELSRKQSRYEEAEAYFSQAQEISTERNDDGGIAKALVCAGSLALYQSQFDEAQRLYEESLTIRRRRNDEPDMANILNNMAIAAANQGQLDQAEAYFEESIAVRRRIDDRWGVANSLTNLGQLAQIQERFDAAEESLDQAILALREIGDRWLLGNALLNRANVRRSLERYEEAEADYRESLLINRELGDRWMLAYLMEDLGGLFALQNESERPLQLAAAASALRDELGTPLTQQEQAALDRILAPARKRLGKERAGACDQEGSELGLESALDLLA